MRKAFPRYHTERTPSRHTDGPRVAAVLTALGRRPFDSQARLLDVALERVDGPGSPWAYDEVIVILGRRCGKTVTEMGVPLTLALDGPINLPGGRSAPFRGAHTAQNLVRARERFLEDLAEPWLASLPDAERKDRAKLLMNLATTQLTLHPSDWRDRAASQVQVFAPTATSMRSAGLAHIGIDEALTFTSEQGLKLLAAARPTMAEFHGLAQMWLMSNVGLSMESWLPELRDRGRAAVEGGRADGVCYVEYSMPDGADPGDESVWWGCYPALGDGLVGVAQLRRDVEVVGLDMFAAEYLNRWPGAGGGFPPVDPAVWLRAVRPGASIVPGSPVWGGVDVGPDGSELVLVAVGRDASGGWLAEVARVEASASQRRVADLLGEWAAARPNLAGVGFDPRTCATAAHWAAGAGVPVVAVDGARWGQALGDLLDRLGDGLGHPHGVGDAGGDVLVRHLAAARSRPSGDSAVLSRARSVGAVSGVVALMCAVHVAGRADAPRESFRIM